MNPKYLSISNKCPEETLRILENNIIGTPGKSMLYKHMDVHDKIEHISNSSFVELKLKSTTVGTCCFCQRIIENNSHEILSNYIRYFSFKNSFRSTSLGNGKKRQEKRSSLRQEIRGLLKGRVSDKNIFYAYLDPDNERSALLCDEFGFEKVREFSAIVISRFSPKSMVNYEKIPIENIPEIKTLLRQFYKSFNFYNTENTFYKENYYVVRDSNNSIIAGVHAHKEEWQVLSLPGISGTVIQKVIPRIPFLNKLFNKKFEFLSLEGLYYKGNDQAVVEALIESLLFKFDLNKAMIFADTKSKIYHDIKQLNLGLLNKLNKEVRASVIVKSNNLSAKEKMELKQLPAYISTFDLT